MPKILTTYKDQLETVVLEGLQLKDDTDLSLFREMTKLKKLDLSYNSFKKIPKILYELSNECEVYIANVHFNEEIFKEHEAIVSNPEYKGPKIFFKDYSA